MGQLYDSWSDLIITQFEHILQDLQQNQIDSTDFESIFALVRANQALLDEIQQPHLLHGDLWTFNILVTREADEPDIVGVLDADYAW
ncbi:phosphotransferase [Chloroflexi bacterium TSY]|nr:phosphotransferase [Chloroflexi bacterium TSY]